MNVILRHIVGAMLGVMVAVVAIQIGVRFILPRLGIAAAAPWTEELARYLMIWSIFLGAAVATRAGALICMDTVPDAVPPALGRMIRTTALLITMGFFGLLVWLGWQWTLFGLAETSTVMSIKMAWVYASMPVGGVLSIINIAALMLERRATQAALEDEAAASIV